MPLDRPTYPGEAEINLQAATLTSSGCSAAPLALDDDPATAAVFGPPVVANQGLRADYYANAAYTGTAKYDGYAGSRTVAAPSTSNMPPPCDQQGSLTIVFTGFIRSPTSEDYKFYIDVDDDAKLYLNGQPFLTANINYEAQSQPFTMVAGQLIPIRVEYENLASPAFINLSWSSASVPKALIPASAFYTSSPVALQPRFLRVDWGYDAFIARIRLACSGPGAANAGVDYESSLSFDEGHSPPADIAFSYIPSPADGNVHEVVFDPPVLGRGVVFYPDALAAGPTGLAVSLSQLQVYQDVTQGVPPMPKPSVTQVRVGCSGAVITPRAANVATTYPFPQALASVLQSIQGLKFSSASKLARETGGDTVHQINGYETDREIKAQFSIERYDYQALQNILAGSLVVNPANGGLPETQYHAPNYGDRAPYFSLVAQSANGDPAANFVLPKCKIDGNLTHDLERDKTAVFDVDFVLFWDFNYTRSDGTLGGIYEWIFNNGGAVALHS